MQLPTVIKCTQAFLAIYIVLGFATQIKAVTFTDRDAFITASRNLRSYDFQDQTPTTSAFTITTLVVDGIVFRGFGSLAVDVTPSNNKLVRSVSVGESSRLTVDLPPGTTAIGFEEFGTPVKVVTSTGEEFTFSNSGVWTFVGFTSDTEIRSFQLETLFNNDFAPDIRVDNLLVGNKNSNQPIAPIVFTDQQNGLPIGLDSVTLLSDPFPVTTQVNFSTDHRTRITLFAVNLVLAPGEDASAVKVQAEDAQHRLYDLPVEALKTTNLTWLSQITAKLTDELQTAGNSISLTVAIHGAVSNKVPVHIAPQ